VRTGDEDHEFDPLFTSVIPEVLRKLFKILVNTTYANDELPPIIRLHFMVFGHSLSIIRRLERVSKSL
jgi:hypothetical protein